MDKVMNHAEDKNVAVRKIYSDGTKFYYDVAGEKEILASDIFNLFVKGVICLNSNVWYTAKSCTEAGVIDFGFPTEDGDGGVSA